MENSMLPQPVTTAKSEKVNQDEQPGLEVGSESQPHKYEQPGLEVAPDPGLQYYEPDRDNKQSVAGYNEPGTYHDSTYPEVYYGQHHGEGAALPAGAAPPDKEASSPWKKWLIIGAIALVIVVGAILGGVFGARAARSSSSAESDEATIASVTPTPSATPISSTSTPSTPTPTSIGKNSPLSAVSFLTSLSGAPAGDPFGHVVVLLFKNPLGEIWASISQVFWSAKPSETRGWQEPQEITVKNPSQNGTGLAMGGYATAEQGPRKVNYNLHLLGYYVNETGFINGLRYQATDAAKGAAPLEINDRDYSVRTGSQVATYWPWVVFQDWSGFINVAKSLARVPYSKTQLIKSVGMQGTRLTVVPLSTDYQKIIDSSYGIFYQNVEGLLTPLTPGGETGGTEDFTKSWPADSEFPEIVLPNKGSFAAFSFARTASRSSDLVNTYVLYQDESADIKQVWTDDSKTWQQSAPANLTGADMGTDITCLTPAASNNTFAEPLYLAPQSNLTRCYFQRGGWVQEVQMNERSDWDLLGEVPMP